MSEKEIIFCKSGGCTAKLGAGVLEHILERLPKGQKDENLLVGYDSSDDAGGVMAPFVISFVIGIWEGPFL